MDELSDPFKDDRHYRSELNNDMPDKRLFYLLIDETKRTFMEGLIVTATVTKPDVSKAFCRLDNGLNAIIMSTNILEDDDDPCDDLRERLEFGRIIHGRIQEIKIPHDGRFEVQLNCKKRALASHVNHKTYLAKALGIRPEQILKEDLENRNFSTDERPKPSGRFVPRRIAHEKFKNISSKRAMSELNLLSIGEFFFRPSTKSVDRITLTWKFWDKHYVHIDINERDKKPGDAIGNTLKISNDYYFDSLREVVESYIIPCNRLVREVAGHPKFMKEANKFEELEERLKTEK